MLALSETNIWKELSSSDSNPEKLPQLLKQFSEHPSQERFDEIHYYIYCQETLYQTTFAAFPYLIDVCQQTDNEELRWYTILNIGSILCELDNDGKYFQQLMHHETIDKKVMEDIVQSYLDSFKTFQLIVHSLLDTTASKDENDKKWLITTLAVAENMYQEGKAFSLFAIDEECSCCCPECEAEFYLEKKRNKLVLLDEEENDIVITPHLSSQTEPPYQWFNQYIHKLEIESLKPLVNDLFGVAVCPECNTKFNVFKGILAY